VNIHLVDGTYELFRAHFGTPPAKSPDGRTVGATRGIIQTLLALLKQPGVTHVGVAFDHVIESFRNDLYPGYKTSAGVPPELLAQFPLAERAAAALGLVVWPMVEFEADDAIATAATRWHADPQVEQVVVCSPDKDLCQLVRGDKIVCLDRRQNIVLNEAAVIEKFGVPPASIPDYLGLIGDSADGFPGVARWGAKSTAPVLRRFGTIEAIQDNPLLWDVRVRGAQSMADSLRASRADAMLFKKLATLRYDVPLQESLDDLRWRGVRRAEFIALCEDLGLQRLKDAPVKWAENGS